jgi:hypothetical protein
MISHYLNNPVLSERMSDDNFNKFSASHIARIKTYDPNPDGQLFGVSETTIMAAMIMTTEKSYDDWRLSANMESVDRSKKSGRTITVDDAIADLRSFISRKEGVIADKFPKGSAVYKELFPNGLKEYSAMKKKNADTILKRFITTLDAHKSDFDASVLTEANDKYNTYLSLRKNQLEAIGKVKDEITDSEDKRHDLSVQLYKNLLTLLLLNAEEPDRAGNFFDESMIKRKSNGVDIPASAPPQPTK